jgi:ATP-dependent protease ClpP protease subunit
VIVDMDRDHWFTAAEAFDYGMIDEILDGPLKL